MSLLTLLLANQGMKLIELVGREYLANSQQAEQAAKALLPVVSEAIKKKTGTQKELVEFLEKADKATLERYLNNPAVTDAKAVIEDGESVLTNILQIAGDRSNIISKLAAHSGLPALAIGRLLPVVAMLAVGAIAKEVPVEQKIQMRATLPTATAGLFGMFGKLFSRPSTTHYGAQVLGLMIESGVSHEEQWVKDAFEIQ